MLAQELEDYLKQNIPMIDYSQLSVEYLDSEKCIIKMPFIPQNKNHVNSMYFGSILIGTEVSASALAFYYLKQDEVNSTVVFKDIAGNFIKRAEADTYFICTDSKVISGAIKEAALTKKRVNKTVNVIGVTDLSKLDEKVSDFKITVSVKER